MKHDCQPKFQRPKHGILCEMTSEHIISLLIEERDKIQAAIDALQGRGVEGGGKARRKPGRPAKTVSAPTAPTSHVMDPLPGLVTRKKAVWTPAKRKAQGERMRQVMAAKRAGKSKGGKVPF
jgi:hypothetical protein